MSEMLGDDWKEVGTKLGISAARLDFISEIQPDQAAKAKMLDTYRLLDESIALGNDLPQHFLKILKSFGTNAQTIAFAESKM